ncbi:hypothetical protein [Motilibacter deserti]|uniref:Uncharacterized protein n=1 Tax=Motilibacter deserti TaxID=2714956 RepID=A0ABX0GZE8_9ACTN|nr:hypothetical protein [Motilibacter deserti]NHC16391.1 hypothetical protein [Motilibacter deserti]
MKLTRTSGLVLAVTTGLAGLGVGATLGPVAASAATSGTSAVSDRVTAIKDALAGLVSDGTITQSQADKVATTLADNLPKGGRGFGGRGLGFGAGLDTAAGIIGVTADELRTQLEAGKTLAQVAEANGVSQDTLVDKLVAAAKTELADAVKAGKLTQAQADSISADLETRITERVTSTRPLGGRGGHHFGGGPKGGSSTTPAPSTSPSATPSPSGTAS